MSTLDTEAFIRDRAARGFSREMVRQALAMCSSKFRGILDVLPDVKWPAPGQSIGRKLYNETIRGHCPDYKREALRRARAARFGRVATYDICGVKASLSDHCRSWADCISVTQQTVGQRLAKGATIYDAFFAPAMPRSERMKSAAAKAVWRKSLKHEK